MNLIVISGSIAFITSFIGLLPQIVKTLRTKSSNDLSMTMLINYLLCSGAWIIYGSQTGSLVVLASNVVGLVVCLGLIYLKRSYDVRQT